MSVAVASLLAVAASVFSISPALAAEVSPTPMTLTQIISAITEIMTAIVGWSQTVIGLITGTPLLMIFIVVPLAFLGVNFVRRVLGL